MSKYTLATIVAYGIEEELVCPDCLTDDDRENLTEDQVCECGDEPDNDNLYFCDRCKKQIADL